MAALPACCCCCSCCGVAAPGASASIVQHSYYMTLLLLPPCGQAGALADERPTLVGLPSFCVHDCTVADVTMDGAQVCVHVVYDVVMFRKYLAQTGVYHQLNNHNLFVVAADTLVLFIQLNHARNQLLMHSSNLKTKAAARAVRKPGAQRTCQLD